MSVVVAFGLRERGFTGLCFYRGIGSGAQEELHHLVVAEVDLHEKAGAAVVAWSRRVSYDKRLFHLPVGS